LDVQAEFLRQAVAQATAKILEGAGQLYHWQRELDHVRLMTPTTRDICENLRESADHSL
jgi:hypothetical protein